MARATYRKLLVLAIALGAAAGLYFGLGSRLSMAELARHEQALRDLASRRPLASAAAVYAMYVAVTGLSLPGATPLSLLAAWLLGFWRGLIVVSLASTTGATLACLLSRYLLADLVETRLGPRAERFRSAWARDGAYYLLTLRLIPAFPFFVVNLAMGLTPIPVRTFWWVSQLGMLPATAVIVYAGSSVPSLARLAQGNPAAKLFTPQLVTALVLLGVFPLAIRWLAARLRRD